MRKNDVLGTLWRKRRTTNGKMMSLAHDSAGQDKLAAIVSLSEDDRSSAGRPESRHDVHKSFLLDGEVMQTLQPNLTGVLPFADDDAPSTGQITSTPPDTNGLLMPQDDLATVPSLVDYDALVCSNGEIMSIPLDDNGVSMPHKI